MSITILLIAAAHAIPVLIFGSISSGAATLTSLVMCLIAITIGAPQYIPVDLGAIGIAWFIVSNANSQSTSTLETEKKNFESRQSQSESKSNSWLWIVIFGILGGLTLAGNTNDSLKSKSKITSTIEPNTLKPAKSSAQKKPKVIENKKSQRPARDLRSCLDFESNDSIARCANTPK